ncbi:WD40-like Beta Propeller Repeat [Chitinophaga sp. CF118]|uniref:OmpA family protein n=1 Tax=Chitinophaga sp. CF118 TaxID=1884367 RepID=UPI0008E9695D|nr:OmpA family protein [Chitinophaga sp. CF118]SFD74452.1 WD40-like Beta Propeller Repeat [Chitinophaga sp. CF118]
MDKRKLQALFSILMAIALFKPAHGQYILKQADSQAALYNYVKAIPLYNKAYKKKKTAAAARGMADSYRLMNDYVFAESWYAKLIAIPDHTAIDEFHYAGILMNNSKYAEAKGILDSYLNKKPGDKIAENMREGCSNAVKWLAAPIKGDLVNVHALNSQWSDWSTEFSNGKIIFASDRPYDSLRRKPFFSSSNIRRKYYGWTGNSYLHLYESNGKDSSSTNLLTRNINGDYHSAHASYTADGRKFYYAVTKLVKKRQSLLGKDTPYTLNVEIIEQQRDTTTDGWRQSSTFPYNGIFKYSVGDPFISPDGQTLYFVADYGDKGYGGTDIYYSRMDENGKWQTPVNMGPGINTAGNERTPVFNNKGILYFASDGWPGMGGLDIYKATKGSDWKVENMESPVNSPQDDFAPAFASNETFYFSSNRFGGRGNDDIYHFNAARVLLFNLSGKVFDKKTETPLSDVVVTLVNKQTGTPLKAITDDKGNYHFMLDSASTYGLSVVKTDYATVTDIDVSTVGLTVSGDLHQDIYPEKADLDKPFKMETIYFDLGKSSIRKDAETELDKLVKRLNDNPTWKVEISSHTDSRANDIYNMKLSQRRAESTVAYLVGKGIDSTRLTAKGYGETKLVNRCTNGVSCPEEEHQANRRTEFTILDK